MHVLLTLMAQLPIMVLLTITTVVRIDEGPSFQDHGLHVETEYNHISMPHTADVKIARPYLLLPNNNFFSYVHDLCNTGINARPDYNIKRHFRFAKLSGIILNGEQTQTLNRDP